MMVKFTTEMLAEIGATGAHDFSEKFSAFVTESNAAKTFMVENQTSLADLQASIKALEGKIVTEARIKEIVSEGSGAAATTAVSTWAASDAGKKIIGGEASRITMEALANVGTQPAKPAPVGAAPGNDSAAQAKALIAEGKFEEAYALDKDLQAEFPNAKNYAAYAKAASEGRVGLGKSKA